jgi:hypothetical protein
MNSPNGYVSNMIEVAAIAAHTIPLRSGLTSKQVRRAGLLRREPIGGCQFRLGSHLWTAGAAISQHNHAIN